MLTDTILGRTLDKHRNEVANGGSLEIGDGVPHDGFNLDSTEFRKTTSQSLDDLVDSLLLFDGIHTPDCEGTGALRQCCFFAAAGIARLPHPSRMPSVETPA
jgi:hypothetical protein